MYRNRIADLVNDDRFQRGEITTQDLVDWLGEKYFRREICALVDCAGLGKVQPEPGQVWIDATGRELTVLRRENNTWVCFQEHEFPACSGCFGGKHGWKLRREADV